MLNVAIFKYSLHKFRAIILYQKHQLIYTIKTRPFFKDDAEMTSATTELCIAFNQIAQETSITKVHHYAYQHLLSIKLQTRDTKTSATRKQDVNKRHRSATYHMASTTTAFIVCTAQEKRMTELH